VNLPNGREQPPVFTDHPALGAGAEVWQWNRLARRMVTPQSSARRRHTGGSAAGPSSRTVDHSGGRGYAPHTRWGSVSVFRVQGAAPWLSSATSGHQDRLCMGLDILSANPTLACGAPMNAPTRVEPQGHASAPRPVRISLSPTAHGTPRNTPRTIAPSHTPGDHDTADRSPARIWPAAPVTLEGDRPVALGVPTLGQNACHWEARGVHAVDVRTFVALRAQGCVVGGAKPSPR
jgi:hypothetical protein